MPENRHFQVNLRGIIDLLSGHLYSSPQVFVRELLQNAVDAIAARRIVEPEHDGLVKFEVITPDERPPTVAVHDNGIGLTENEVHQFLATIGHSSKRDAFSRDTFIGQFGIGLLSAFVVSDEIVVITRSIHPTAPTIEWKGRADGSYSIRTLDLDCEPGTQVYLHAKAGCEEFFQASFIRRTASRYGKHLPGSIQVCVGDVRTLINEPPPWEYEFGSVQVRQAHLIEYGELAFGQKFLDVIPLESEVGGVVGVAYVSSQATSVTGKRSNRVYLKNMLLSERVENLLPDWAFFVRCVINSSKLRPTAAREGFYDDEQLAATRDELGACIRQYLVQLAQTHHTLLETIIDLHHLPIKSLAIEDDDFFQIVMDWLPYESTLGRTSFGKFRAQNSVIRYVPTCDQFRQVKAVAASRGIAILNTGYTYDTQLVEKAAYLYSNITVERAETSKLVAEFEDLSLDERDEVFDFVRFANVVLQPFQCTVDIKTFEPSSLAAMFVANEDAAFLRSIEQTQEVANDLWSGLLDTVAEGTRCAAHAELCLNFRCELIRELSAVTNRELLRRAIEIIYVQSLLLGHYPLKEGELNLLNGGLLSLLHQGAASGDAKE